MDAIGNMKPDKRIFGIKKKNAICIVCSWVFPNVEITMPTPRLATIKRKATA
jgi:hypothetical protein